MIELRRRYSGSNGNGSPSFSRLPAGYQEVEYLKTKGQCSINIPDYFYNYKVRAKVDVEEFYDKDVVNVLFGSNSTNSLFWVQSDVLYTYLVGFNHVLSSTLFDITIEYYSSYCNIYINSQLVYNDTTAHVKKLVNTILCNASNESQYFRGKIFHFSIEGNEGNSLDLIPCYRISDRKPGMYDIVNNVFYTNAGTGEFSYGPDVHYNIPFEYQEVEWLKGDGNAYIKANFIVNSEQEFEITFRIDDFSSIQMLFGISSPYYRLYSHIVGGTNQIEFQYQNNVWNQNIESGEKYIFKKVDSKYYLNNVELPIQLSNNFQSVQDFYIFSCNGELGRYESKNYIYIIKLHDRQFIPCYRREDNTAGMYDIVNGVFYTNAGTGTFEVGPKVIR